jgi:hypothetical protein
VSRPPHARVSGIFQIPGSGYWLQLQLRHTECAYYFDRERRRKIAAVSSVPTTIPDTNNNSPAGASCGVTWASIVNMIEFSSPVNVRGKR